MTLMTEATAPSEDVRCAIAATLASLTKLRGAVEFVAPGTLPNDGKVIADARPPA